ncbi:hypothetical protein [Klebsiella pneumoniae IS10]|nr:hypothetical protein [Klebsiella pneumoniae IS10]
MRQLTQRQQTNAGSQKMPRHFFGFFHKLFLFPVHFRSIVPLKNPCRFGRRLYLC